MPIEQEAAVASIHRAAWDRSMLLVQNRFVVQGDPALGLLDFRCRTGSFCAKPTFGAKPALHKKSHLHKKSDEEAAGKMGRKPHRPEERGHRSTRKRRQSLVRWNESCRPSRAYHAQRRAAGERRLVTSGKPPPSNRKRIQFSEYQNLPLEQVRRRPALSLVREWLALVRRCYELTLCRVLVDLSHVALGA